MTDPIALFNERQTVHLRSGLTGRALFDALAVDANLPLHFKARHAAAIAGLTPGALAMRRQRGQRPTYLSMSHHSPALYPRHELMAWLADLLNERSAK